MDLSDLRVFRAVALASGITRAAEVLHRVPSNVTTRVQNLEADLGAALFRRSTKRWQLSPQGRVLLSYADRILELADEAREATQGRVPGGLLRLGAMESTAAVRLPALLTRFNERHAAVTVALRTGSPPVLTEQVLRGELDAALVAGPVSVPSLAYSLAYVEELVIIGPAGRAPIRRARDLQGETLLAFEEDCPHRQRLEAWCLRDDVVPRRILDLGSYQAILGCCAVGMGVALVPAAVLDAYADRARLSVHRLKGDIKTVKIQLIWRQAAPQPAITALAELLGAAQNGGEVGVHDASVETVPGLQ